MNFQEHNKVSIELEYHHRSNICLTIKTQNYTLSFSHKRSAFFTLLHEDNINYFYRNNNPTKWEKVVREHLNFFPLTYEIEQILANFVFSRKQKKNVKKFISDISPHLKEENIDLALSLEYN
jgi:hypothetical protein